MLFIDFLKITNYIKKEFYKFMFQTIYLNACFPCSLIITNWHQYFKILLTYCAKTCLTFYVLLLNDLHNDTIEFVLKLFYKEWNDEHMNS